MSCQDAYIPHCSSYLPSSVHSSRETALSGFLTLVALVVVAAQVANAALTRRLPCADGHVTAHAACCGPYSTT